MRACKFGIWSDVYLLSLYKNFLSKCPTRTHNYIFETNYYYLLRNQLFAVLEGLTF